MANLEKHLEFILSAISRMAQNSFLARGWCITLTTALLAVASNTDIKVAYALAGVPIIVFWVVDAYYLSLERRYRLLYEQIRMKPVDEINYAMDIRPFAREQSIFSALFSPLIIFIYGSLISLIGFLFFVQG